MPKKENFKSKSKETSQSKSERVSNDVISYYERVSETLNSDFPSEEEKDIFVTNVCAQVKEDGLRVCRLSGIARTLEKLLTFAGPGHVITLLNVFSFDWHAVVTDRMASHVLQTLIGQLPKCLTESELGNSDDVQTQFLEFCEHMSDNFSEYLQDTYGSHIIRAVLQVLGGITVSEKLIRSRLSRHQKKEESDPQFTSFTPSEELKAMLKRFAKEILVKDKLKERICCPLANPVIQTLLLIYNKVKPKQCEKYLHKLVKMSGLHKQSENLPVAVTMHIGSYLVEQILDLGTEELFTQVFDGAFKGRTLKYAVHPVANLVLQKLLANIKDKEQFEELYDELSENFEDILALNHHGIITKLAGCCLRFGCKQKKLVQNLMKAFHCDEPVERQVKLVQLVASLTTYDVFFGIGDKDADKSTKQETTNKTLPLLQKINLHGSLFLQEMLKFGNPKLVVNSLVELKPVELKALSCDPCGSHVIDAFCQSSTVGEKSHDLLFSKMKDIFMDLACNKNGSRTMDMIWKTATMSQKVRIADQLSKNEAKLRGDQYGHHIHRNFGIFYFINRRKDWQELQGSTTKKRKLFSDIIGDAADGVKKKKTEEVKANSDTDESGDEDLRLDDWMTTAEQQPKTEALTNQKFEKKKKKAKQLKPQDKKFKRLDKKQKKS